MSWIKPVFRTLRGFLDDLLGGALGNPKLSTPYDRTGRLLLQALRAGGNMLYDAKAAEEQMRWLNDWHKNVKGREIKYPYMAKYGAIKGAIERVGADAHSLYDTSIILKRRI